MTRDALTIEISPKKGIALFSTSLMFVAIGAALVLLVDGNTAIRVIGWTSIVTFGFFGALWLRQIVTMRGPVLTVDHDGLIDRRVSEQQIPWNQVEAISTWTMEGQRAMVLKLDPAFDAAFPMNRLTRWTRGVNRKLGADGISITAAGLRISYDELLAASLGFAGQKG